MRIEVRAWRGELGGRDLLSANSAFKSLHFGPQGQLHSSPGQRPMRYVQCLVRGDPYSFPRSAWECRPAPRRLLALVPTVPPMHYPRLLLLGMRERYA